MINRRMILVLAVASLCCCSPAMAEGRKEQSLDGSWQIVFDRNNEGKPKRWFLDKHFPQPRARSITVPSCWELTEKDYEGVAFYRREFDVPPGWKQKTVRLQFDAVNFRSEFWLNDQFVGVHEGGFTPIEFPVDRLLNHDAKNVLIVRVVGPILMQDIEIDGMGKMETPQWRGAITGGIWQPVRLVATGNVYVKDVFIEPRIEDNTASFHLQLENTADDDVARKLEITIRSRDQVAAKLEEELNLGPGVNQETRVLAIPTAKYWSPSDPHLYHVDVKLGTSDQWTQRFGMREFTIRNRQWMLNGEPLHLKATFFEGLYPGKLAYPDSREMVVREIQLAKDAGFNMIRPWRKPPPAMWLDVADEMGVLTVGSMAIECMDFPWESTNLQRWVENEVRESILRDRGRTCVVQWELFNELKRPVLKEMLEPMVELARELDPTRLILDESGGWAFGARMYLPYSREPTKFNDIHDYPGQKISDDVYTKLLLTGGISHEEMIQRGLRGRLPGRNVVPGLMTYFSELGYGSLPDLVDNNRRFAEQGNQIAPPAVYHRRLADQSRLALRESGFDEVYPDLQKFCLDQQVIHGAANARMIEAVRCNPNVEGYCIHALTDGDWIIGAGLLDLFRNPKTFAYEATKAANQPRILSIRVRPRNIYAARGTKLEIMGVNDGDPANGSLKVEITDDRGRVVLSERAPIRLQSGISRLLERQLDTTALRGRHEIKAQVITDGGTPVAENTHAFDVFQSNQLTVPRQRIALLDPTDSLARFLKSSGIEFEEFHPHTDTSLPVFVSQTVANTRQQRELFDELKKFIQRGGTAVYLQGGGPKVVWGKADNASSLLPVKAMQKLAMGHWICIPRLVKDHPVFAGLPVGGMMGPVYENVWPQSTLQNLGGETIAGSIGYDWFPDYDLSKRHYYGPGDVWWGADVAIVPFGEGRFIASQLRLVENVGKDPAADRILYNLIEFAATR